MTSNDGTPLHTMRPGTRFTDRAADYVRYRPDYPAAAIDRMVEGLRDTADRLVADLGAGTGISARALADRGFAVVAVEPNAAMRAAATPHPRVRWIAATAESTSLATAGVDLVVTAQAFHWFDHERAIPEIHRILRHRGGLVLMWNSRSRIDALTRGYIEAIHAVHGEDPAESRPFDPAVVSRAGRFTPLERSDFDHAQRLDRRGLLGRAISASYVPKEGPEFEELVRLLDALWTRHRDVDGNVTLRYTTQVWRATRL